MAATYPITGINAGSSTGGAVPIRRDVDEWWASTAVNDVNQKTLLIQAMTYFQNLDVTTKLSYFQIAGIHGQPLVPWDENTKSVTDGAGYCTHGSVLFPSWHRPYLLLVEQRLHEIMIQQVIPTFAQADQADLRKAADSWRLPYWDWASHGLDVPEMVKQKNVQVRTLTGTSTVRNPFWDFQMPAVNGKLPNMGQYGITEVNSEPFEDCIATSKHPPTNDPTNPAYTADWVNGSVQDNAAVTQSLTNEAGFNALPEAVYRLFTEDYFASYDAFASTRFSPVPPQFNPGQNIPHYLSLESIHNNIHGDTGGLGHMSIVPVAAFDPIFWLHHCNVDRLYAIWQALYPEKWFTEDPNLDSQRTDTGTWSNREGMVDTPQTALTPFHTDANGTYWNSDAQRDWTKLGYSYTELQPWLPKYQVNGKFDQATYQNDIKAMIDRLYGSTSKMALAKPASAPGPAIQEKTTSPKQAAKAEQKPIGLPNSPHPAHHTIHATAHHASAPKKVTTPDIVANVLYPKFALHGNPYTIHILLGTHQVGTVYNFSAPPHTLGSSSAGCGNCHKQKDSEQQFTGQVVLTNALLASAQGQHSIGGRLESMDREDVAVFLREKLSWRVTNKGEEVDAGSIEGLKVSIGYGMGEHCAEDGVLSRYGGYECLWDVTQGRTGGAGPDDGVC